MPTAQLPGDLLMHYEDDDFSPPWGKPETVILQHGQARNASMWYGWTPHLAKDYRVIRTDARGFGQSSVPPPRTFKWSLEALADDIANLMDHLGIEKTHIIGEVAGGAIALQFAYQYPERTLSVATCSSPFRFRGDPTYMGYHRFVSENGIEAWGKVQGEQNGGDYGLWYGQQMGKTTQHVVLETLEALSQVDLTPTLPLIKTPSLVMVGKEDTQRHHDRANEMASLLANCTLVEVDGGYRAHHLSAEKYVAAWKDWVKSLPAR